MKHGWNTESVFHPCYIGGLDRPRQFAAFLPSKHPSDGGFLPELARNSVPVPSNTLPMGDFCPNLPEIPFRSPLKHPADGGFLPELARNSAPVFLSSHPGSADSGTRRNQLVCRFCDPFPGSVFHIAAQTAANRPGQPGEGCAGRAPSHWLARTPNQVNCQRTAERTPTLVRVIIHNYGFLSRGCKDCFRARRARSL